MQLIAPISSVNCFDFFAIEIMDEVMDSFIAKISWALFACVGSVRSTRSPWLIVIYGKISS